MRSYEQIYQDMMAQLELCEKQGLSHLIEIEQCFAICYQAMSEVEKNTLSCLLKKEEEICYLKNIRPVFIAQVLYYQLLYHAALFLPDDRTEARKFWKRELQRWEKFTGENLAFYQYYKKGRTDLDGLYFTGLEQTLSFTSIADESALLPKTGDLLVSELLCLERYTRYVEKQLELLATDFLI